MPPIVLAPPSGSVNKVHGTWSTRVIKFIMRAYIRVGSTKFLKINFRNSIFNLISKNYSFQKFLTIQYIVLLLLEAVWLCLALKSWENDISQKVVSLPGILCCHNLCQSLV